LPAGPDLGATLLRQVADARAAGADAEAALRSATLEFAEALRNAERKTVAPPE
jgi:XTP/dITP diphosphohydrolase